MKFISYIDIFTKLFIISGVKDQSKLYSMTGCFKFVKLW